MVHKSYGEPPNQEAGCSICLALSTDFKMSGVNILFQRLSYELTIKWTGSRKIKILFPAGLKKKKKREFDLEGKGTQGWLRNILRQQETVSKKLFLIYDRFPLEITVLGFRLTCFEVSFISMFIIGSQPIQDERIPTELHDLHLFFGQSGGKKSPSFMIPQGTLQSVVKMNQLQVWKNGCKSLFFSTVVIWNGR